MSIASRSAQCSVTPLSLYDYNFRGTDHILHATDRLDTEQLNTTLLAGLGSLRVIFVHAVGLEWLWRTRWQGGNPAVLPSPDDFPTQAAIHMRWRAEQPLMRILGDTAPGRAWARVGTNLSGQARRVVLWRTGHSPNDLDMIVFSAGLKFARAIMTRLC